MQGDKFPANFFGGVNSDLLGKQCISCGKTIPFGTMPSLCSDCTRVREMRRTASKHKKSDAKVQRRKFYSTRAWRKLSAVMLQRCGYTCESCGGIATEVHHKQHLDTEEGWAARLLPSNLACLCHGCHDKEHGRFVGGGSVKSIRANADERSPHSAQKKLPK